MKKKIFVRGPVLSQSGYGEQARFALRALRSREDIFDIYIQAVPWGQTGWVWQGDEFRTWLDNRITATQVLMHNKQLHPDISLQITIPNEFQKICPVNIGYTAGIEATKVSPPWLQKGNDMDKILVVSNHAKDTYVNTTTKAQNSQTGEIIQYGLNTPVEVVWESTPRSKPESIPGFDLEYDFNFLMVSQIGPRKNFINSLEWWVEEFIDQEVGLVVKGNIRSNSISDWQDLEPLVSQTLNKYPDRKCKVYLLHGDLTSGQMNQLYTHPKIKAMINISHGEGFGLPMFEAAREGLPIVTIGWSGQVDFLSDGNDKFFQEVDFTLQPISPEAHWPGVLEKEAEWAYATQGSYKMTLRKTYKAYDEAYQKAQEAKKHIEDNFNEEKLFKQFCEHVYGDTIEEMTSWSDIVNNVVSYD
jgi:glycosyltransferase involved in cell wall biosynthesis